MQVESDRKLRRSRGAPAAPTNKPALEARQASVRSSRSQGQRAAAAVATATRGTPADASESTKTAPPRQPSVSLNDMPLGNVVASLTQRLDVRLSKGLLDGSAWEQDHAAALKQFCQVRSALL